MPSIPNMEQTVNALLKDPSVRREIEREGVWFRDYKLSGMLRFVFELTSRSMQVGFYDVWNGDVVKDEVWKFKIKPDGQITPTDYFSDTASDFRLRRFALDKDFCAVSDWDFKQWEAGRIAAEKAGILSMLANFDSVFHMKYESMLLQDARKGQLESG